jgi:aspartyl-tRNA(Asn)/glutamyl-tRNA(Gln) amidotransferase subunit B
MVEAGELSSTAAKSVFEQLLSSTDQPQQIAEKLNLLQVSDKSELEKIVSEVIAENPEVAADIRGGQDKALGFLVGQVMAKTKGQANPALAQEIIKQHLK